MRTSKRNKQKMMYALMIGNAPEYALDKDGNRIIDYTDELGNVYYRYTGEEIVVYSEPVEFYANIALNAGDVQPTEFGLDISSYDASVTYLRGEFPITETSLVWFQSEPKHKGGYVDASSADYRVASVKPSLNYEKLLLRQQVKGAE